MDMRKLFLASILVLTGVLGRFILVKYVGIPNFEIITAVSLVAGIYLAGTYAIVIPLTTIFLSDLVIGNNYIFIFTWTAFALIGLAGSFYRRKFKGDSSLSSAKLAIAATIFFYVYTNFGWWLMSGMYQHSASGLIECYIKALPFLKNQLLGNLIFVPFTIRLASYIVANLDKFESFNMTRKKINLKNNQF